LLTWAPPPVEHAADAAGADQAQAATRGGALPTWWYEAMGLSVREMPS
jgi:hypothetical protein